LLTYLARTLSNQIDPVVKLSMDGVDYEDVSGDEIQISNFVEGIKKRR